MYIILLYIINVLVLIDDMCLWIYNIIICVHVSTFQSVCALNRRMHFKQRMYFNHAVTGTAYHKHNVMQN